MKYKKRVVRENEYLKEISSKPIDISILNTVGGNRKTGYSFYYPLITCAKARTRLCSEFCYAHSAQMTLDAFVKKTLRVYTFVENHNLDIVVQKISWDIPLGIDSFRWLGTGELTPKLVKVINRVANVRSEIQHYIYTKSLDLALELDDAITVNFSVDKSTSGPTLEQLFWKPKIKQWNISYVAAEPREYMPKRLQDRVDVIHPVNKRKAVVDAIPDDERHKICDFAIDKRATCLSCKRCIYA